jgi:hypothetical protein
LESGKQQVQGAVTYLSWGSSKSRELEAGFPPVR